MDDMHFPAYIDWYYSQKHLKINGLLIIDDLQLHTGNTLFKFLKQEKEWKLIKRMGRAAVFRKLKEGSENKWWEQQKYLLKKSPKLWLEFIP